MDLAADLTSLRPDIARLARGEHRDPFAVLGKHKAREGAGFCVRVFRPDAVAAALRCGSATEPMRELAPGFFSAPLPRNLPYRLAITTAVGVQEQEDPYRFGLAISAEDAAALKAGRCWRAHHVLGAQAASLEGVAGVRFAVWAPNARRVAVVGDWNGWNPLLHPMRYRHEMGAWEIFLPGLTDGCVYAFDVLQAKAKAARRRDPYARSLEPSVPGAARCTAQTGRRRPPARAAIGYGAILAVDAAGLAEPLARERLLTEAQQLGFSHLLLRAAQESVLDPVLGPLPIAPFAPAAGLGGETGLAALLDGAHARGLRVLADWPLPAFPATAQGWASFDGRALYEPGDARRAQSPSPGARRFDFARWEAANLLLCAPLRWLADLGLDGLFLRGVQEALRPGYAGGAEIDNAAVEILRNLSELAAQHAPHAVLLADATQSWPGVTAPTSQGGLGLAAVRRPEWAGLATTGAARLAALLSLEVEHAVRAVSDWPIAAGAPAWSRVKLAALLSWTLPGWTLLAKSELQAPFPGAVPGSAEAAAFAALVGRLNGLRRSEPAFSAAGRLRLLAQPRQGGGVLALSRRAHEGAHALTLAAPNAPFAGRAPAPHGGRFQVVAAVGVGLEGWLEAKADPRSPSDYSLDLELPAGAGLLLSGYAP